jgi:hypothetical protein
MKTPRGFERPPWPSWPSRPGSHSRRPRAAAALPVAAPARAAQPPFWAVKRQSRHANAPYKTDSQWGKAKVLKLSP